MKSLLLAIVISAAAMGVASAQTPSMDAVKACIAKVSKLQPLSLGQNMNDAGWFWVDACLRGQI